jgi:hypothetical protein
MLVVAINVPNTRREPSGYHGFTFIHGRVIITYQQGNIINTYFCATTDPAFNPGERWVDSSMSPVFIVRVEKYPGIPSEFSSNYGVIYLQADGTYHDKDAWSFQVRYNHTPTPK